MNNEVIELAKKEYKRIKKYQDDCKIKYLKVEDFEKNEEVKEYLELYKKLSDKSLSLLDTKVIKERMEELSCNKSLIQYFFAVEILQQVDYIRIMALTESDIIKESFAEALKKYGKPIDTNGIYASCGKYRIDKYSKKFPLRLVDDDEEDYSIKVYRDIENNYIFKVSKSAVHEFEKNHSIIELNSENAEQELKTVRTQFLGECIYYTQEKAVQHIKKLTK